MESNNANVWFLWFWGIFPLFATMSYNDPCMPIGCPLLAQGVSTDDDRNWLDASAAKICLENLDHRILITSAIGRDQSIFYWVFLWSNVVGRIWEFNTSTHLAITSIPARYILPSIGGYITPSFTRTRKRTLNSWERSTLRRVQFAGWLGYGHVHCFLLAEQKPCAKSLYAIQIFSQISTYWGDRPTRKHYVIWFLVLKSSILSATIFANMVLVSPLIL